MGIFNANKELGLRRARWYFDEEMGQDKNSHGVWPRLIIVGIVAGFFILGLSTGPSRL